MQNDLLFIMMSILLLASTSLLARGEQTANERIVEVTAEGTYGPAETVWKVIDNDLGGWGAWQGADGREHWTLLFDFGEEIELAGIEVAFGDHQANYSHVPVEAQVYISDAEGSKVQRLGELGDPGEWIDARWRVRMLEFQAKTRYVLLVMQASPHGRSPLVYEAQFFVPDEQGGRAVLGSTEKQPRRALTVDHQPGPIPDDVSSLEVPRVVRCRSGLEGVRMDRLSYTGSWDGTDPLYAYAIYPVEGKDLPVIVCMHGYSESAGRYIAQNKHRATEGWFVLIPEMRGRGGSAGRHDSGGLDILDIYDAVQSAKETYGEKIDPTKIGIQGWSGGGGNVSACMVKLPDTFNVGASFFGMSNYKTWQEILDESWEAAKKAAADQGKDPAKVGRYPGPAVRLGKEISEAPDLFAARETNLAAANNPYTKIFLFNDEQEPTCLPKMDRRYKKIADEAGLENVTLIVSSAEDAPMGRFRHGSSYNREKTEKLFMPQLASGEFPPVTIADTGHFRVLGFVVTKPFQIFAGDGQNAVAEVDYRIAEDGLHFESKAVTSDPEKPLTIRLPKDRYARPASAGVNGRAIEVDETEEFYVVKAPGLNATIDITVEKK